jgi:hypothetical protein
VDQELSVTDLADPRIRRQVFLDIARRRARPGTGSARSFLEQRMATKQWPDLSSVLGDIPWAVIGDVATRAYMPERVTQDLDILIAQVDAEAAYSGLRSAGFELLGSLSIGGTIWRTPSGVLMDLVESREPWVAEALDNLRTDPQGLPVLSLPYLVLMKVHASRTQDLADASRMLGLASEEQRQRTRQVFAGWLPDAQQDLESLIVLGDLEMGNDRP